MQGICLDTDNDTFMGLFLLLRGRSMFKEMIWELKLIVFFFFFFFRCIRPPLGGIVSLSHILHGFFFLFVFQQCHTAVFPFRALRKTSSVTVRKLSLDFCRDSQFVRGYFSIQLIQNKNSQRATDKLHQSQSGFAPAKHNL